jgi:penicillin-binding protein 2
MLIFDQLKKNDPQLRLLATVVLSGLFVLLAGLWWLQIVKARDYQSHLETQSFRTVRIPAVRGKILDRNGVVLAENRPSYNVSLYLEDLRPAFDKVYDRELAGLRAERLALIAEQEKKLGRSLTRQERKTLAIKNSEKNALRQDARYSVASNAISRISLRLDEPISVDPTNFNRHYATRLALPYSVLTNLDAVQIARFEEQLAGAVGADLEMQTARVYPRATTASHVLGYLRRDNSSAEGEFADFSYRLPDYRGVVGIEGYFDQQLRGQAGAKSVLVNNLGYRQSENVWAEAQPGSNVVLTLDVRIQEAAENALARRVVAPKKAGAVVVMDVNTGDILALASAPTFDPSDFAQGISTDKYRRVQELTAEKNRATQENYAPGSIFKPIVAMAALEAGLNPKETITSPGHIYIGRRYIGDLAPAGEYDFRRALKLSCNTYFITNGLRTGIQNIVKIGQRLHLGERVGLQTWQETSGIFPDLKRVSSAWRDGDTANICIGQGEVAVTPLQMAVLTCAIANGGKVLWPRLVDRIESQDPLSSGEPVVFESGRVRDELGVRASNLNILKDAMLADTEDPDGTGRAAAGVPGLRICGKTGTAQVTDAQNRVVDHTTWFISFAPYEKPRYAVVVMVESGGSGGGTCAPVAHDIYTVIQKLNSPVGNQTVANAN